MCINTYSIYRSVHVKALRKRGCVFLVIFNCEESIRLMIVQETRVCAGDFLLHRAAAIFSRPRSGVTCAAGIVESCAARFISSALTFVKTSGHVRLQQETAPVSPSIEKRRTILVAKGFQCSSQSLLRVTHVHHITITALYRQWEYVPTLVLPRRSHL